MRCSFCHNRLLKSGKNGNEFFFRHLAFNKSTGALIIKCYSCNKTVVADTELHKALRASVLLLTEK